MGSSNSSIHVISALAVDPMPPLSPSLSHISRNTSTSSNQCSIMHSNNHGDSCYSYDGDNDLSSFAKEFHQFMAEVDTMSSTCGSNTSNIQQQEQEQSESQQQ